MVDGVLIAASRNSEKSVLGAWWPKDRAHLEIARLKALCARLEEVATRHAIMLREGDHRIKNSLQIVAGLMHVQARREENSSARAALTAAASRIQSIARIHDALQAAHGKDVVDIGVILTIMCETLQAMAGDPRAITVRVEAASMEAPVALAQPIVLAINELVVNSLRHAFPDGRAGTILVEISNTKSGLNISVADDGVGLPADYANGKGYGMRLVHMMAGEIGGALHVESGVGARFTIAVPAAKIAGRMRA